MDIVTSITRFVQNGISFIFDLIARVINWAIGQVQAFANLPWGSMSVFKLIFAALVIGLAGWLLWKGGRALYDATLRLFQAFGSFVSALIAALPMIGLAGIALAAGIWVIRTFSF
jgi:hypothetical protein